MHSGGLFPVPERCIQNPNLHVACIPFRWVILRWWYPSMVQRRGETRAIAVPNPFHIPPFRGGLATFCSGCFENFGVWRAGTKKGREPNARGLDKPAKGNY